MKVVIRNQEELMSMMTCNGCKIGKPVQQLVRVLLDDNPILTFKIAIRLLPDSYGYNPQLFGRTICREGIFFRSYLRGNYLYLRSSLTKEKGSFVGKIERRLGTKGKVQIKLEKVPLTYRRKPSIVTKLMRERTGFRIKHKLSEGLLTWSIA